MLENIGSDFIDHTHFFDRNPLPEGLYLHLAAKTNICTPWTQESEVSKDNHFPISMLSSTSTTTDSSFSAKGAPRPQRFHLNELPENIVDAVVVERDESVLGGGNDICKVARRTLFFARERAEGIKHHSIIPSPQLVPLLFANSDSAKEVSHDTRYSSWQQVFYRQNPSFFCNFAD